MSRSAQDRSQDAAKTSLGEMGLILGVAVALALGFSMWMRSSAPSRENLAGLNEGTPAPAIEAVEWVNGEPSGDTGRVRLVHAWFYGCPYCWKEAPELVALHEEYGDRVEFIGLAGEDVGNRALVEDYLDKNNISWPNGFGRPFDALEAFEVQAFPAMWVIDRNDRVIWNRDSDGSPEQAIEKALAG